MDPNNAIVKLCANGMAAESAGRAAEAKQLFERAWNESTDDFEACIAAHYVARHQPTADETLRWNLEALRRAEAAADERVRGFYPSLYLNLAHSLETTGSAAEALRYYSLADAELAGLPPGPYANLVRVGVEAGLRRLRDTHVDPSMDADGRDAE